MSIKNYLTPEEKLELQQHLKSHEHPDITTLRTVFREEVGEKLSIE